MNRNEQQYANVGAGFKPAPTFIHHFTKKGNHVGLPLLLLILFFFALNAFAQQTTVAVLPSEGASLNNDELEALTDKMREAALKVLPAETFILLKQDVVVRRLGGAENYIKECSESSCIVDLGKKAQVDYVAQASVGKLDDEMRLKVELYNVRTEGLVGIFNDEAENLKGLLAIVDKNVPNVFGKIPGASSGKVPSPTFAGGIGGVQIAGGNYEFAGEKSYLVNIATEPQGAVLSFNGVPDSRCTKTPCRAELAEGSVRIIANLEQYEIADTTVSIKQNNQSINIRLKANFGVLEIKPAYLDGIGNGEQWSLAINDKTYHSFENRLNPGKYEVKLSHECYEALSFEAGINKDKRVVFNMASQKINLKMGGLALRAEQDGEPVSEPVFVNGERVGETPFSGTVPVCANIEVGSYKERVNVRLKHNEKVAHTHKMPDSEARLSRMEAERKKKQDDEEMERIAEVARRTDARIEEAARTAKMGGWTIGGGVSLNMNEIEPNYFKSLGGQFNMGFELYRRHLKFFRYGLNLEVNGATIDKDEIRRTHPDVLIDSVSTLNVKVNAFARLYPVDFLFLSGGVGYSWYSIKENTESGHKNNDIVNINAPIFPVGGGICLCSDSYGFAIEGLYNIVPFKGRTAAYMSINGIIKGLYGWK
jgi:hypothetical protein